MASLQMLYRIISKEFQLFHDLNYAIHLNPLLGNIGCRYFEVCTLSKCDTRIISEYRTASFNFFCDIFIEPI